MFSENNENINEEKNDEVMDTVVTEEYGAEQIQVLKGLEAVRKRPGMYIGSTGPRGLHHLVYEIVDNSIDEALAGYCTHIEVEILPGNVITVRDNGRGIPVDINEEEGLPAVTVVLTVLHAGGKFGGSGYKVSGGLHGVGSSVVNALSEWFEIEVSRQGHIYHQRFERGDVKSDLEIIGDTNETGTFIKFKADPEIFTETTEYDFETLQKRLREQAFLNAGLSISLTDKRDEDNILSEVYCYEGGIRSFVDYINKSRGLTPLHEDIMHFSVVDGDRSAEVAMSYNDGYNEIILSFANDVRTIDGGTHEMGFKTALTRVFNDYGKKFNLIKDSDKKLSGDDVREGLTAVISVKLTEAQFEGQTKGKLGNTEITGLVSKMLYDKLMTYLEENPSTARTIQAILPLWGKMLNVEKARVDKVIGNEKLTPVILALGTGIGDDFDITKLRYHKIVLMADADVDGAHIRTLLLTFFFRYMRPLIEHGYVYIAQPPLFKVSKGKKHFYAFSDEERDEKIAELGGSCDVQRYKGLGEMDSQQLWETTMDPKYRTMLRVNLEDAMEADETFSVLMGDKVEPRREFIEKNAKFVQNLDI